MSISRLSKADRKILVFAVFLLIVTLFIMLDDGSILSRFSSKQGKILGNVTNRSNDVRHKMANEYSWKNAKKDEDIHAGDSVFTGSDSTAIVTLRKGSIVELSENSLVTFVETGDQLNLDLKYGSLLGNIAEDSSIKLKLNGEDVELTGKRTGQEAKFAISSDGQVRVLQGDVSIGTKDQSKVKLVKGSEEKKVSSTNTSNFDIKWSPKTPKIHSHYDQNPALSLQWIFDGPVKKYKVQTSQTNDFTQILFESTSETDSLKTADFPAKGTFFYRVIAYNSNGTELARSTTTKIEFSNYMPPQIITPSNGSVSLFKTNIDGDLLEPNQLNIQWQYTIDSAKYEFQLSKDSEFNTIEFEQITTNSSLKTPALPSGTYFIRVRDAGKQENDPKPWSPQVSFSVELQKADKLAAPIIIQPNIDLLVPAEKDPKFSWTKVNGAKQYVVEISTSAEFLGEKQTLTTDKTELDFKDYYPGDLYYRVFASTKKGNIGEPSRPGLLSVRTKTPTLYPTERKVVLGKTPEDPGEPQDFLVKWAGNEFAEKYVVEVSQDPKFKQKKRYLASTTEGKVTIPAPGQYFWRVKAYDGKSKSLSSFSEIGNLTYILKVPLAQPELVEPAQNVTLYFQKSLEPFFWLEWKPVRQASKYLLEISSDPEFSSKLVVKELDTPRYLLKDSLPQGQLFWRVMAVGEDDRISHWSEPRKISLFSGRRARGFKD